MAFTTETVGFMWYCGDEVCECSQPRIEQRSYREDDLGRRRYCGSQTLWEGQFRSQAEADERADQLRELAEECDRRGIPVPDDAKPDDAKVPA